jgi:hypothetical protein
MSCECDSVEDQVQPLACRCLGIVLFMFLSLPHASTWHSLSLSGVSLCLLLRRTAPCSCAIFFYVRRPIMTSLVILSLSQFFSSSQVENLNSNSMRHLCNFNFIISTRLYKNNFNLAAYEFLIDT